MTDVDLLFRVESLERRVDALEQQRDGAGELFVAIADTRPVKPEVKAAPRAFNRRELGSIGCQEQNACSHTPCLCAMAWRS